MRNVFNRELLIVLGNYGRFPFTEIHHTALLKQSAKKLHGPMMRMVLNFMFLMAQVYQLKKKSWKLLIMMARRIMFHGLLATTLKYPI